MADSAYELALKSTSAARARRGSQRAGRRAAMGRPAISGGRRMSGVENTARVEYATTASVAAARSWRVTPAWMSRRGPASSERHGPDADRVAGRRAQDHRAHRRADRTSLRFASSGGPVPAGVPMVIAASRAVDPGRARRRGRRRGLLGRRGPFFVRAALIHGRSDVRRYGQLRNGCDDRADCGHRRRCSSTSRSVSGTTSPRGEWRSRAACRGSDPAWWHPQRGTSLEPHRAICRGCEVRLECLTYALAGGATQDGGIWAGSSARQRRVAKRRGWDAARLLAELDRDSSLKRRTVGA